MTSFTSANEFFKGKTETFPAMGFLLELIQPKAPARGHIPPKGCQNIRRYGLYASRTKGKPKAEGARRAARRAGQTSPM